jgi:hypothetical protein
MQQYAREFGHALADGMSGNKVRPGTLWGSTKALTSDGTATIPANNQLQTLLNVTSDDGVPKAWVINMSGRIQQPSASGVQFPYAKFLVSWGSAGSLLSTEVDGFSDQFLMVFGNQVQVSCQLDVDQATRTIAIDPALEFPKAMVLSASLARSEGARVAAKRSFVCVPAAIAPGFTEIVIPYAATGVILRTREPAALAGSSLQWRVGTFTYDILTAGLLGAAHDRGEYIAVPSEADRVVLLPGAGTLHPMWLEFLLEP